MLLMCLKHFPLFFIVWRFFNRCEWWIWVCCWKDLMHPLKRIVIESMIWNITTEIHKTNIQQNIDLNRYKIPLWPFVFRGSWSFIVFSIGFTLYVLIFIHCTISLFPCFRNICFRRKHAMIVIMWNGAMEIAVGRFMNILLSDWEKILAIFALQFIAFIHLFRIHCEQWAVNISNIYHLSMKGRIKAEVECHAFILPFEFQANQPQTWTKSVCFCASLFAHLQNRSSVQTFRFSVLFSSIFRFYLFISFSLHHFTIFQFFFHTKLKIHFQSEYNLKYTSFRDILFFCFVFRANANVSWWFDSNS